MASHKGIDMPRIEALIVGINDYGDPRNNLNSCVADAAAMEGILREVYGFQRVTTLLDGDATIAGVDAALTALLAGATPEDRLVFFYSGHGYQVQKGESREEVLALRDGFYEDERLIAKTQALPPGVLTVILDSGFSGRVDKILIPGPDGFDVALSKVWRPDEETVRRESEELLKATRVVFKGFGRAPAVMPAAVAHAFMMEAPFFPLPGGILRGPQPPSAALPDITVKPAPAQPSDKDAAASGEKKRRAGMPAQPPVEAAARATPPSEEGQVQINALLITAGSASETVSAKTYRTEGLSPFTYGLREVLKGGAWHAAPRAILPLVTWALRSIGVRQTPLLIEPLAPRESGALLSLFLNRPAQATWPGQAPQWMQPTLTTMTGRPTMAGFTSQILEQNLINQIAAILAATQQAQAAQSIFPLAQGIGISPFTSFPGAQQYLGAQGSSQDASRGLLDVLRQAGQLGMQYGHPVYNAVQQILNRGMQLELAGFGVQVPSLYGQMSISPIQALALEQQRGLFDVLRQIGQLSMQYGHPVYNLVQSILNKGVQWNPMAPSYGWQAPISQAMEADEQAKFLGVLATLGSQGPGLLGALVRGMHQGLHLREPFQSALWSMPFQQMR